MAQYINDVESVLKYKDAKKEAENERQKILAEMQKTKAEKTNMIKKALAVQRAKFGAGGSGDGMSKDAVLDRLKSETAESYDEKLRAASEKMGKIKSPKMFNIVKNILGRYATDIFN